MCFSPWGPAHTLLKGDRNVSVMPRRRLGSLSPLQGGTTVFGFAWDTGFLPLVSFCFWLHHAACGILVPQLGIEPTPSAVKAQSPNHWTVREFPPHCTFTPQREHVTLDSGTASDISKTRK